MTVAWPSPSYLKVAAEIQSLADAMGTTKNRLLVINDTRGDKRLTKKTVKELLKTYNLDRMPFVLFPYLENADLEPIGDVINAQATEAVDKIIDFARKTQ